jgi:hypothetical protein
MPEDLRREAGLAFKSKSRRKWEDRRKIAKSHSSELFRKALAISAGIQDMCLRLPHDPRHVYVAAAPYSEAGGTGTAGTSLTVTITVVSQFLYFTDGAYAVADEHEGF